MQPFHLAIPTNSLENTRKFYVDLLGCSIGRESPGEWIDINFFGHQLSIHLKPEEVSNNTAHGKVDGKNVPVRHFGVVLEWDQWQKLSKTLQANNTQFVIEPYIRFEGQVGEQATMFFMDPSGNALEFKSFKDIGQLFAA